jgi:hypothetical protein
VGHSTIRNLSYLDISNREFLEFLIDYNFGRQLLELPAEGFSKFPGGDPGAKLRDLGNLHEFEEFVQANPALQIVAGFPAGGFHVERVIFSFKAYLPN